MTPSVILTNWTVYYSVDTGASGGYKQIRWTGGGSPTTNTNSVNELYSALMDLFSNPAQLDAHDTTPMRAVTPTVYEIGAFDQRDQEPWFIDPVSIQHLTGGSLSTANWTRISHASDPNQGNSGIIKVPYTTGTQFIASDIGRNIVHASGDTGTLLYFANNEAWIRPTNSTVANNWDTGSGTFSVTAAGGTGSVTQAGSPVTGERVWSNIFTIGTIYSATQLYVTQNFTTFTPWWGTGHLDRLFLTDDDFDSGLIDSGLLTVYAREYGYLYDHFTADLSGGGRSPVPLATSVDLNNTTASGTISALTGINIKFGEHSKDLGNGNGFRPYDIEIDCGSNSINDFYEYTKYISRRSATTPLSTSLYQDAVTVWGRNGEQYIGPGEIIINLDSVTAPLTEGEIITGDGSNATGVLVGYHTSPTNFLVVRDVRGTFIDNENITDEGIGNVTTASSGSVETITPSKTAPFGTFAGGQFFGARGVYITNMLGADSNNYSLIDSTGTSQSPPSTIGITVSNTLSGDRVSVFRALDASGNIDHDYLLSHASANTAGLTTFQVDAGTPIPSDTPSSGVIRVVDQPGQADHRFRYASWSGTTFTFVTTGIPSGAVDSVGSNPATSFRESNANLANILPGDIVRNTSDGSPGSWAHVLSVTLVTGSTYDVVHTPLQGGTSNFWTVGNNYSFNNLPVSYNGTDHAYVPYIDQTATSTSVSVSVQYASNRNITTRVRRKGMQPYNNHITSLTSSGYSTSVTRIPDDIVT